MPAPTPARAPESASIAITLKIPATIPAAWRRRPAYVSAATKSAMLRVNGSVAVAFETSAASNPDCTPVNTALTCTATIVAPLGSDTFSLSTYDGPLGGSGLPTGRLLSTGNLVQLILPGTANAVDLVLSGAVASLSLGVATNTLTAGTPGRVAIAVDAFDADGFAIVGSPRFVDANGEPLEITLSDSDPGNTTTLSGLAVSGSGGVVTLNYNGTPPHGRYSTITASAASVPGASVVVPVAMSIREFHLSGVAAGIASAPAGGLYVSERTINGGSQSGIATISSSGVVVEKDLATADPFAGIVLAGDGRLYIGLTRDGLDIYDPVSGALSSETFAAPGGTGTSTGDTALGADGRIWELGGGEGGCFVAASTPSKIVTIYPYPGNGACGAGSLVLGPDGRLWFPDAGEPSAITTAGVVTSYSLPSVTVGGTSYSQSVSEFAVGPGGDLFAQLSINDFDQNLQQQGCEAAAVLPATGVVTGVPNPYLNHPGINCDAVVVDATGSLVLAIAVNYYHDQDDQIVRTDRQGNVTSIDPSRDYPYDIDSYPSQTARDAAGNVYILANGQPGLAVDETGLGKVIDVLY